MSDVGDRLSELRKNRGLKQSDVSELINVSASSISSYERGKRDPNFDVLTDLSEVYDVTIDYILGKTSSDISPRILEDRFIDGVTFGEIIKCLRPLSEEDKNAVYNVIDAISARSSGNEILKSGKKFRFK
ncbi:MAG: helix-turn-helix domain-containing protein [Oscillospiraceae bacterium]|nr:helix-turn-helix domain-containing protein [Oscillospiraceae bacterium]